MLAVQAGAGSALLELLLLLPHALVSASTGEDDLQHELVGFAGPVDEQHELVGSGFTGPGVEQQESVDSCFVGADEKQEESDAFEP
jgi:hypothetical protein